MAVALRLANAAEALASIGALLRARTEGLALDPEVARAMEAAAAAAGFSATLSDAEAAALVGAARAFLRQSLDLIEDPQVELLSLIHISEPTRPY